MLSLPAARVYLGLIAGAGMLGCGASFESLYESEVRFEHCYRLDLEQQIAPTHRLYCWEQWLDLYAGDQPLDRIHHAETRAAALKQGEIDPQKLSLSSSQPTRASTFTATIDPTKPPPATQPVHEEVAGSPSLRQRQCAERCLDEFAQCRESGQVRARNAASAISPAQAGSEAQGDGAVAPEMVPQTAEPEGSEPAQELCVDCSTCDCHSQCRLEYQTCSGRCVASDTPL